MATPTIPERAHIGGPRRIPLLPVANNDVNRPEEVPACPSLVTPQMESMRNRGHTAAASTAAVTSQRERTPTYAERMETRDRISSSFSNVSVKSLLEQLPFCGKSPEQIQQRIWTAEREQAYKGLRYENVDDFPEGYPRASAWLASDGSFQNIRSFRTVSTRILMEQQNKLQQLEKRLFALDKEQEKDPIMRKYLRGWNNIANEDSTRKDLMEKITEEYLKYGSVVGVAAKFHSLDATTERDYRSIFNYFWHERPLAEASGSADFLSHLGDFVSLAPQARRGRWFEDFIVDKVLQDGPPSFSKRRLQTPNDRARTGNEYVSYYDPWRLALASRVLSALLITSILLIPVYLLFLVPMTRGMMAFVSSLFISLFVAAMLAVTNANEQEIYIGAAAYGAVLLIFLGNIA